MNTHIIPVTPGGIGGHTCLTVDGRTLHAFLEVGKRFADWINDRIQQYSFTEGEDFEVCFPNLGSKERGGHNAKDYTLTLNMAKELAMVERTPRGQQARRYFIACEEELLALKGQPAPELPAGPYTAALPTIARLDAALLRELRLISPPLAQVYLIDMGITPEHVAAVLDRHGIPSAGIGNANDRANALPLDQLRPRLDQLADAQDSEAWYCQARTWATICAGHDPRATLIDLHQRSALIRGTGPHLTIKARAGLFGRTRPRVYAIRKAALPTTVPTLAGR